jgi:Xaa-Pro aminopeptidase
MLPDRHIHGKKEPTCEWPQSERSKKIFETVQRAQRAALDKLLTPNSTDIVYAAQVDKAARDVISAEGWGEYFTHRLGHGSFRTISL